MKFNQLEESIIKVPSELLNKVNVYVSSVLSYKLKQYINRFELLNNSNTTPEMKKQIINDINQTIAKLQQKYGAKNISTSTYSSIDGKNVKLTIDFDKFFNELQFKGITPEMIEEVKRKTIFELLITGGASEAAGSVSNDNNIVRVMIHTGRLSGRDSLNTANSIMRTVYHECQHVVQEFAIKTIQQHSSSKKVNKQLDLGDNYSDEQGYYTSGVEYTPQLGDVINAVSDILERDAISNKLDSDMNRAINNAISDAYQENKTIRLFLGHQRQKNPDGYKKALKAIYSKVSPVYKQLQTNGVDYRYSDLEPEVLEANINVMATILQMARAKKDKFIINGKQRGDDIQWLSLESKAERWKVIIAPKRSGEYQISFSYDSFDEQESLDSQAVLNFVGIICESYYYDADDVLTTLDSYVQKGDDVTEQDLINIKDKILSDAEYMEIPFDVKSGTEFVLSGISLGLFLDEDSPKNIILKDESEELYFVLPPMKVVNLLQSFIRASVNNAEEAKKILLDFDSYISKINRLRNI